MIKLDDNERTQLQQVGVRLTREGKYDDAKVCLRQALDGSVGVDRANILRDLADVAWRYPGGGQEARDYIVESAGLLEPKRHPVEFASTMHFAARVSRSLRKRKQAQAEIKMALGILRRHKPTHIEELYTTLDAAAIYAINFHPLRARRMALRARHLVDVFEEDLKQTPNGLRAYRLRARILCWLPWWPFFSLPPLRHFFWGRSA